MRIGIDGTPLLGARSGVGWYTAELVRALAAGWPGDRLTVWAVTWRRPGGGLDDVRGPNVAVSGLRLPARAAWESWRLLGRPRLERLVRCDVFHGTNYLAPPSRRTPVVVTVHDIGFVRHPELVHPVTRRHFARHLPAALRRASAVIAVSAFTKDELTSWMPEVAGKVHVVHNGPHERVLPAASTGVPDGPPYALFVGNLDPRKNLVLLLDALGLLRARGVELRAVLAGAPSPLVDVPRLAEERGLSPRDVVVTGYVRDDVAAALYRDARVFAFPSRYEGFGLPLVEAMRSCVPIVAARAGSIPEVVADAAILTDPDDPEAFADALERGAADEDARARLRAAGTRRAADFDWGRTAAATRRVYERVLA